MNIARLQEILDAFGADPKRWPDGEREAALSLIAGSEEARQRQDGARRLDALLDAAAPVSLDLDAAAMVARIAGATANVRRFPGRKAGPFSVLWRGAAGLAAAAVAGFVVGWFNLAGYSADTRAASADQTPGPVYSEAAPW